MEQRPVIKIELTNADKICELAALVLLITLCGLVAANYTSIPEIIPTHFNFAGKVDAHGSKAILWILPGIGTILYAGLTLLNRYPQIFNMPTKITPENAERQYKLATRLIRILKMLILAGFCFISNETIRLAKQSGSTMNNVFMIIFISLVFGTIIIYLVEATKKNIIKE